MATKQQFREKIAKLDQEVKELEAKLETTQDEAQRDAITDELYSLMSKTNRYLRAIGADESEMYDL